MIKHELLVPAGDMESLQQAIFNGADAVYLGCKNFGARKFAKNFSNDEIINAIKLAHLYGVKVYVTMNTLIKDSEVSAFLNQVEFLHRQGIDAILIQDFGMMCLVLETFPNLEVHASTQANTSSKDTAELYYKLGVKRVVFSREMTLEEINAINVPIEKEVFIHGALCICYSGECLMSSMLGTRSGNRGECAGSCRLPYSLEKGEKIIETHKYLLSTKELNIAPKISELLKSNITSFKIEGRMKSPEYVGFITKFYRNLIDNPNAVNLQEEIDKLKTIFNREFTYGNLFLTDQYELINKKTPNHIGLEIGKVISVTPEKIKIKLTRPLNQHDAIRFLNSCKGFIVNFLYDKENNLVSKADDICYVDNKVNLQENDVVCKTKDSILLNELKNIPKRKIKIDVKVIAKLGEKLKIIVTDGTNKTDVTGNAIQASINSPITKERIITQIKKLGDTPFLIDKVEVKADENIFISIKELNDLRRLYVEKLIALRQQNKVEIIKKDVLFNPNNFKTIENEKTVTAQVFTEEQLKACLNLKLERIYTENVELYNKYKANKNIVYKLPRCSRNPQELLQEKNLLSDYLLPRNNHIDYIGDYHLNVTNIYTIYYLHKLNIAPVNISVELTEQEIIELIANYKAKFKTSPNIELLTYGLIENMIIKGNILKLEQDNYDYHLIDAKERRFPVFYDGVNTHILNYEKREISDLRVLSSVNSYRFNFFKENSAEIKRIISNIDN